MTRYIYKNEKTKEIIEKEFSMQGEIPKSIEQEGKIYIRYYGTNTAVHIPYQWGQESNIKLNKSPSGRKHFF